MKKVFLALALATMIVSCKETKTEKVETITEVPAPADEPVLDTVTTKTETTVDTMQIDGSQAVKKTEKTEKTAKEVK